ncbi:MAG TPA: TraB/GumN family protein [Sphingomicrobium sp.]|nr:TraB/GumN family protein [Sphingomicrobium sp.]
MLDLLFAAGVVAASPGATVPAMPEATPAMYMVRDADTTIYIFGTFHALDGEANWFGERLRAAFDQSSELVLETLIPDTPAVAHQFGPGFRPPSVTPSGSFLATTRMAIDAGRSQGMQVEKGADMILRRAAEAQGKPVAGLETLELQFSMFNRMPAPATVPAKAAPSAAARDEALSRAMVMMQAAWKRGDQSVFVSMLDQLRNGSPETYRMMFTERNERWADWIRARMQTPGTVFVAVGTGHLVGKDSLLVRLAERGISSQRVN